MLRTSSCHCFPMLFSNRNKCMKQTVCGVYAHDNADLYINLFGQKKWTVFRTHAKALKLVLAAWRPQIWFYLSHTDFPESGSSWNTYWQKMCKWDVITILPKHLISSILCLVKITSLMTALNRYQLKVASFIDKAKIKMEKNLHFYKISVGKTEKR